MRLNCRLDTEFPLPCFELSANDSSITVRRLNGAGDRPLLLGLAVPSYPSLPSAEVHAGVLETLADACQVQGEASYLEGGHHEVDIHQASHRSWVHWVGAAAIPSVLVLLATLQGSL